ncbi:hypothetical protein COO60DRAFT_1462902 [Scenedesmus sp. NREL 46B-D3]|nr:hypothetical protein COO60DRAFT_1462902 [Scenedesmus sp. NREL 46B-D3]
MKCTAVAMLLLLSCAAVANAQQPICKTYKKLLTSSSNKLLMDPIRVAHSAPIASVVVNSMSVAFPKIGDLQVSLLRAPLGSSMPDAAVVLKKTGTGAVGANLAGTGFSDAAAAEFPAAADAAPFTGSFKPAQPLAGFNGKDASDLQDVCWLHTLTSRRQHDGGRKRHQRPVRAASGPLHSMKGAAWGAVHNEAKDFATLLQAKSAATKTYLNKKLSDHINLVNGASQLMQAAIKGQGGLLRSAGDGLMGHIGQLKAGIGRGGLRDAAKAGMAGEVDNLMKMGGHFMNLAGSVLGDMGSTATLMKDAATAKAKHVVDTYTTTEGVVKAHIDNGVQRRMTRSAPCWALEAALDKLAAMVKATPTPSQVVQGKMAFASALAGMHPLGKAVTDPEAALAGLMGKMGQFKQMLTSAGQGHAKAMMSG